VSEVTISEPSGRELSLVKAVLTLVSQRIVLPETVGSSEIRAWLATEIQTAIEKLNPQEIAREAKLTLPPAELVHSEKAFENAKIVIGLYLREFPDALLKGFTRAQVDGFYRSSNLRDRVDAGAPHKFAQTRIAELKSTGYLRRDGNTFFAEKKLQEELRAQGIL